LPRYTIEGGIVVFFMLMKPLILAAFKAVPASEMKKFGT